MIKVFLVEDEKLIREGIKKSIDWEKEGYLFSGEAGDGELALPMILKEKPDILITDIRMPFMDGLALSKLVKKELPDIKILVLSGYDDFEYAKKAIQVGVTEYLLKPISSSKLLEVLRTVADKIEEEQSENNLKEMYLKEMNENVKLRKTLFLSKLLKGEISFAEAMEEGEKYDIKLSAPMYEIVLFNLLIKTQTEEENEKQFQVYDFVEKIEEDYPYIYSFQRGVEGFAFIITANEEAQMQEREKLLVDRLKKCAASVKDVDYFGGLGSIVSRLRELNRSFKDADKAFSGRFTQEPNQILSSQKINITAEEKFEANSFGELEKTHSVIEKFLNNGAKDEISDFVKTCLREISEDSFKSLMLRQYIMMNIYVTVMSFCEKIHMEKKEDISEDLLKKKGEELKKAVGTSKNKEDIQIYIEHLIEEALDIRNLASEKRYSDIMEQAKKKIEESYMEDISLNIVADSVGMSASYFSSVFRKEMGKTFVEYLTEIRMEKAKELLVCTSMKTSEVGFQVGYKDPHYFSYIFKKIQGCSPKEYRSERVKK